ncbi:MAG: 1-phosphofructokinase family hexose kinase [Nitrospirota bacterium]
MKTIVTLTMNPAIDTSTSVDQVLPERKLRCAPPHYDPGGGGINVSRAMHRLGGESAALFTAGGPTGQMLKGLLDSEGIINYPVPVQGWTRENMIVLETGSGRQYRFGMPGPRLTPEESERCLERLSSFTPAPDCIVASGSLPPGMNDDFYAAVARQAAILGSTFILDTSGSALEKAVREGVYLLKPNRRELGELVGRDIIDDEDVMAAARGLVDEGFCTAVVVSLGAEGAVLVTAEQQERASAPPVPVVSAVGAGDSMLAGIVLGLARGRPLSDAFRFGIAAGAAAVMTPGTELCRREDTERLFAEMLKQTPAPAGQA